MLAEQGRVEEAFRLLEGWADRRSDLPEPKVELARLLEKTGDRKAAKECLTEALAVNPNHARVRAELARVQEQMGETQEALANYYRSYQQDRFQPEVAARIAALQSTLPAPAAPINVETPQVRKETRLASRSTGTLR
jgi:lipopolysaccharide biosynthesis regulator YciM